MNTFELYISVCRDNGRTGLYKQSDVLSKQKCFLRGLIKLSVYSSLIYRNANRLRDSRVPVERDEYGRTRACLRANQKLFFTTILLQWKPNIIVKNSSFNL